MTCEECGKTGSVRFYEDPECGDLVALCESCADSIFDSLEGPPYTADEDPDDEFANTCITAADYMREDDGS